MTNDKTSQLIWEAYVSEQQLPRDIDGLFAVIRHDKLFKWYFKKSQTASTPIRLRLIERNIGVTKDDLDAIRRKSGDGPTWFVFTDVDGNPDPDGEYIVFHHVQDEE